jgi:serine protease Do
MGRHRHIGLLLLLAALLAAAPGAFAQPRGEKGTGQPAPQGQTASQAQTAPSAEKLAEATKSLETIQYSFREVAKKVLPVVVEIDVQEIVRQQSPQLQSPWDWFFNQPPRGGGGGERELLRPALGSGIIVKKTGDRVFVLTNNHVVGGAKTISIRLHDQRVFKASLMGNDPRKDIALVYFDTKEPMPIADLGDSNTLEVGDLVLAIGNPLGFESSVTMGIVSALGRRGPRDQAVSAYTDYIQTDASINQGNSGGALVNVRGEVIGINTWIAAPSGGNVGLGFAIPINNAKKAIDDFMTKGRVEYGWLGVQIGDVQDEGTYAGFAKDLKVNGVKGAFVWNVYKGSPADKAGILPGDFVTRVGDADIKDSGQLTQVVGGLFAGKNYDFELVRYGERQKLSVRIGVRDDKDEVAQYKNLWPGMTVVNISDDIRKEADIPASVNGVVIGYLPDQDTPASIAGFKPGDVITEINGKPSRNMLDYYKAINDRSKKEVTFKIWRKSTEITIGLGR